MRANELLFWLSARRQGSWQQFRAAVEELHSSDNDSTGNEMITSGEDEFPLHQQLRLDLARLALDDNAPVDFTTPHWHTLVASAAVPYFRALGWTETTLGGLPAARSGPRGEVIIHPLWADVHPEVLRARNEVSTVQITQLSMKSLFELVRRPF